MLEIVTKYVLMFFKVVMILMCVSIFAMSIILIKDIIISLDGMMIVIERLNQRILEVYYD